MKVVILAGGSGSRLFPLSRRSYPKQFLHIAGEKSLLVQTVERFLCFVQAKDIVVVTNEDYIYYVQSELKEAKAEAAYIITEPQGKNTAPAIALALAGIKEKFNCDPDEIIFITPSDHLIKPLEKIQDVIEASKSIAEAGNIVTFGIKPTKPETGYGYIKINNDHQVNGTAYPVEAFKEKPDLRTATSYIKEKDYYWNSGMWMFSMAVVEKELQINAPEIDRIYKKGYEYLLNEFAKMPEISFDYAIAEKSSCMILVPLENIYWNDIGCWDSVAETFCDKEGNMLNGDIIAENCINTMILGDERLIAGIDLQDLIVVDTQDVLLIAKKGKSQDVKKVVEKLKLQNRKEVEERKTVFRPWGRYTVLAEGDGYKVKRITVNPGAQLSLQLHYHRSEHWTVISGTGRLILDDKEVFFRENESTYIPIGVRHRLENSGQLPLSIIEVQNGKYLGEDDIVRFDDVYGRNKN